MRFASKYGIFLLLLGLWGHFSFAVDRQGSGAAAQGDGNVLDSHAGAQADQHGKNAEELKRQADQTTDPGQKSELEEKAREEREKEALQRAQQEAAKQNAEQNHAAKEGAKSDKGSQPPPPPPPPPPPKEEGGGDEQQPQPQPEQQQPQPQAQDDGAKKLLEDQLKASKEREELMMQKLTSLGSPSTKTASTATQPSASEIAMQQQMASMNQQIADFAAQMTAAQAQQKALQPAPQAAAPPATPFREPGFIAAGRTITRAPPARLGVKASSSGEGYTEDDALFDEVVDLDAPTKTRRAVKGVRGIASVEEIEASLSPEILSLEEMVRQTQK